MLRGDRASRWRAVVRRLSLLTLFTLLTAACPTIYIRMGERPNIDLLENSLRAGESTSQDVLAALGRPYATGRWMLPTDGKARTVLTYYYEDGTLEDARRMLLFVYLDEDRYDGYMWFSSLAE